MTETLLQRVIRHEGFSEYPYEDSVGVMTIGHGLTHLTEEESEHIVERRLWGTRQRLAGAHDWIRKPSVLDVMTEMCFQLGWTGCHNFKYMWSALEVGNYDGAANEMLDSKWHEQTPKRCEELADIIRSLA